MLFFQSIKAVIVTPFADECLTTSGPSSGMKCIFPFKFRGETYNACKSDISPAPNGDPWCSTKVDNDGVHIGGQGNWGVCSQACPVTSVKEGCNCVFPFRYEGISHNACTYESTLNASWCSTANDDQGNQIDGYWATCSQECPFESANDPKSDEIAKDGRCIV